MMKGINNICIMLLMLSIISLNCIAQKQKISYSVVETVDNKPQFPGGVDSLKAFMYSNFELTALEFGHKGYVVSSFTIDTNGTISDIKITRSLGKFLDEEIKRVIGLMPKWKPATVRNKPVKCTVSFVVYINFDNY